MAPSRAASALQHHLRSRTFRSSSSSSFRPLAGSCYCYTTRIRTHPTHDPRPPLLVAARPLPAQTSRHPSAPANPKRYPGFFPEAPNCLGSRSGSRRYSADAQAAAASEQAAESGPAAPGSPEAPEYLDGKERAVFEKLKAELAPTELEVQDISGGCGSMYAVAIASDRFKGLSVIKQHRLVNQVLGEQIKSWHGIQLKTKVP